MSFAACHIFMIVPLIDVKPKVVVTAAVLFFKFEGFRQMMIMKRVGFIL